MGYNISAIDLSGEPFKCFNFINCSDRRTIENLSRINIFIGSNNCGKSRFLRNIYSNNSMLFSPKKIKFTEINDLITEYKGGLEGIIHSYGIVDYAGILSKANVINHFDGYIFENNDLSSIFYESVTNVKEINGNNSYTVKSTSSYTPDYGRLNESLNSLGKSMQNKMDLILDGVKTKYNFNRVYIPTLRGLRCIGGNNSDFYKERTANDYFPKNSSNGEKFDLINKENIFTGLSLYEQVKSLLLGDLNSREKISKFQKFLGDSFFEGQEVALIPSINSDVLYVKIGGEKEQPIYNLGDGIQSIIILTFPLFSNVGNQLLYFVEEPELYLHPGLQRKFLEVLLKPEFDDYQFFITTHSNHFLDITLDVENISVYTFKKDFDGEETSREKIPKFIIENVSSENNSVLDLLGVKNSSVFLSNCTIWVEGITDRYYLRRFFEVFQNSLSADDKKFKEDIHYSFVEYSGNNITHWSFLDDTSQEDAICKSINVEKVCSKLFLITDKDSEKKLPRQEKLTQKLKDRYYCINCKEIENILKKDVVLSVVADYEKIDDVNELEFKIVSFDESKYKNKYLGKFIEDNLLNKKRQGKYNSESGTVSDKVIFCKKAIKHIKNIDDISDEAIELCKKIYNFVKECNQ